MSGSGPSVSPKIELSLLAEYLMATPRRRERILLEQREHQPRLRHFRAADECVCGYLLGIPKQERNVRMKIDVLRALGAYAPEKKAKIGDNIAALEAFLEHPGREFLDEVEMFPGPRQGVLHMAGVHVVVSPEIVAVDPETNSFGFVKLRFSRRPLASESADVLMTVLQAYAQGCAQRSKGALNLDLTCVVDVFDGTILRASTPRVASWSRVREACKEIAAHWPLLFPRPARGMSARRK